MKNRKSVGILSFLRENGLSILIFCAMVAFLLGGLRSAESSRNVEELKSAEDSIRRAVISCYAIEGRYPESFEYIQQNYGVRINLEKYHIFYEVFASNIMPDVTVVERTGPV